MSRISVLNYPVMNSNYNLITVILFWCGLFVVSSLYMTIPLTAVFSGEFEVSTAQAAWTGSSFSFCYAISFLFFGPLSDRYGRKQIILIGLIALAVISLVIGFANNLPLLITLRGIQGIAAAAFAPTALAYVVEIFPVEKRVTTIGFISSSFLMSGIVGQVISSIVNQRFSWELVFYIFGGIYIISALLVVLFIPKNNNRDGEVSGFALFKQLRRVLTNKSLLLCYSIALMLLLSFVAMYSILGNFLSGPKFGLDNQKILYIRSLGIFGMLLSPFSGQMVTRFGNRTVLRVGLCLAIAGLLFLGVFQNLIVLSAMSIVFVAGISITVPSLISLVGYLGGEARGIAVSMYMFILFIGATLGPIIAAYLLKTGNYLVTFSTLAVLLIVGLVVSLFLKSVNHKVVK
ncbi:MFS transporter [Bacillus subtilis]|jgi:predicted MFS family arabinose efflux permease|uniref:MFS transporter n=1 Tax=Bacillus subtilis TaxID=1423 RepID=UPI000F5493F4|nr:MFS transporter [Bacillus subtilis]MDF4197060.1 MFS transporter [Bacillus subtilis]MDF4218036.1 MFS transporter [Bacillus subtilis]RPK11588.1 hypothetical protein EH5_01753 [Bacillus subtilis]